MALLSRAALSTLPSRLAQVAEKLMGLFERPVLVADYELLRHGCRRAQGYPYGRPVDANELLDTWGRMDAGHGRIRFG